MHWLIYGATDGFEERETVWAERSYDEKEEVLAKATCAMLNVLVKNKHLVELSVLDPSYESLSWPGPVTYRTMCVPSGDDPPGVTDGRHGFDDNGRGLMTSY